MYPKSRYIYTFWCILLQYHDIPTASITLNAHFDIFRQQVKAAFINFVF